MAMRRFKKVWSGIKAYFTVLELPWRFIILEAYSTQRARSKVRTYEEYIPDDNEVEKINSDRLAEARLEQDREATNLNLRAQHRVVIATLITALVALISAGAAVFIALHSKPPVVYVRPTIIIKE